jgi:hypothetical protein
MRQHHPTSEQLVFPPVRLDDEDRRWPTWSVNVDLPPDVEVEIAQYTKENEFSVWTVLIHEALYIYRWQFWTREELEAELREAIEEGIRSAETEGTIEATPQFWKDFKKRCNRDVKKIRELKAKAELGNLLLPKELYAFIVERIESGECRTPTYPSAEGSPADLGRAVARPSLAPGRAMV